MEDQKKINYDILKINNENIALLKGFSIDIKSFLLHIDIDTLISPKSEKIMSFFLQTSKKNDIFIHKNNDVFKFLNAVTVMADFGNIDYSINESLSIKADIRYDCVFCNDVVYMNNGAHLRSKTLC